MLEELRDRLISYLSRNHVCVIATNGSQGAWAIPARYENAKLELSCRLPRWSDALFHMERDPHVMAIIPETDPLRWLEIQGIAYIANSTDDRYVAVHIKPERIDLIDEQRGWGWRETLDV